MRFVTSVKGLGLLILQNRTQHYKQPHRTSKNYTKLPNECYHSHYFLTATA